MTRYAGRKAVVLGATGMGVAVAKRLVEGGADVLLAARDEASADAAVPEVGSSAHVVVAAPGEPAEALVAAVAARLRRVDHLVVAEEAPHAVCALLGLIGEGGSVVFITAAAPATDRLAAALAGRGIRLNTVTPGCMDAGADAGPAPLGRRGSADEVARAALFLAVDATFTTGARLPVDGGLAQLGTDADGAGQAPDEGDVYLPGDRAVAAHRTGVDGSARAGGGKATGRTGGAGPTGPGDRTGRRSAP